MSRIRSVHPGFFTDESLVSVSAFARLLFIGLGIEADDKGAFEWKPLTLKMKIFPADTVDVSTLLEELTRVNAIMFYEMGGRKYGAIRNFRKFQRPKTPNDLYPVTDEVRNYVGLTKVTSEPFPPKGETLPPEGEKSPQMEDGGDKMEEVITACDARARDGSETPVQDLETGEASATGSDPPPILEGPPGFSIFWELFPAGRRGNRAAALTEYARILRENQATEEEIHAGTRRYAASDEVQRKILSRADNWLSRDGWKRDYDPPAPAGNGDGRAPRKPAGGLTDYERIILAGLNG